MTKKQQILNSAIKLFSEKGYDGVSTKEISENAEVSEALIFKHFKSKQNLFFHILEFAEKGIYSTLDTYNSNTPSLKEHLDSVYNEVTNNTVLWRLFHINRLKMSEFISPKLLSDRRENIINLIDSHIRNIEKSSYIVSAIDGIVGWYVLNNDKITFRKNLDILYKTMSNS